MESHQALSGDDFENVRNLSNADLDVLLSAEGSTCSYTSLDVAVSPTLSGDRENDGPENSFENSFIVPSIMRFNREELSSQFNFSQWSEANKTGSDHSLQSNSKSNSRDFHFNTPMDQEASTVENDSSLIFESPEIEIISLNETEESVKSGTIVPYDNIKKSMLHFRETSSVKDKTLALISSQGSPKTKIINNSFSLAFGKIQEFPEASIMKDKTLALTSSQGSEETKNFHNLFSPEFKKNQQTEFLEAGSINDKTMPLTSPQGSAKAKNFHNSVSQEFETIHEIEFSEADSINDKTLPHISSQGSTKAKSFHNSVSQEFEMIHEIEFSEAGSIKDKTLALTLEADSINDKTLSLTSLQCSSKAKSFHNSVSQEFEKIQDMDFEDFNLDFELIDQVEEKHYKTQIDYKNVPGHNLSGEIEAQIASCPAKIPQRRDNYNQSQTDYRNNNSKKNVKESECLTMEKPIDYSRSKSSKQDDPIAKKSVVELPSRTNAISDVMIGLNGNNHSKLAGANFVADASVVPLGVKQLYDIIKEKYTDFAFVYALGAQLCQDRVPMDCFVYLKLGLLLSLASIGPNPDRPPIPIVAIGNDAYMCNYLLTTVGQLAARFIGPTDDVKPPAYTFAHMNYTWIEADPLVLAKGGVFYVGDWCRLKAARAEKLFKDIECSRVVIEKTKHVCPLETAVWAHWRSFKYNSKDQQTFSNFIKVFGIPIIVDDNNHEVLVNYILEQSSISLYESTIDHLSISAEDMRMFLAAISNRTVDLSDEASEILQKYFVASRVERPDCLSKQAFSVLKQFAESFAKLSLRHEVLAIDAYAAIFMCENFIQNTFGTSEDPPPQFESHNYIGNVDAHMVQFKIWLNKYIKRYYDKS